mgnify:CR=1 FL=1
MVTPTPISFGQVAMLCEGPEGYGIGTVLRLYTQAAPEVLFVCAEEGAFAAWLRERGLRYMVLNRRLKMDAQRSSLAFLPRVAQGLAHTRKTAAILAPQLEREGIRVVHTHWLEQQVVAMWLRGRGFRSVWHLHNTTSRTRLMGLGLRLNHLLARRGADALIPVSAFIAGPWRTSGVPIQVVRNAATRVFDAPNTLAPTPIRCVIAGALDQRKGHHLAVEGVLAARAQGVDVRLDLFGGPLENNAYVDNLRERIDRAGASEFVRFMGFRSDLRRHHQEYHVGLQCRVDPEPCSMWVCETLVDGLPLLAADNGGTPELVEDGTTGLLFESGNAQDLAAKLVRLAHEPSLLNEMRKAAFERGNQHFTTDRMIRETLEAYRVACG